MAPVSCHTYYISKEHTKQKVETMFSLILTIALIAAIVTVVIVAGRTLSTAGKKATEDMARIQRVEAMHTAHAAAGIPARGQRSY